MIKKKDKTRMSEALLSFKTKKRDYVHHLMKHFKNPIRISLSY